MSRRQSTRQHNPRKASESTQMPDSASNVDSIPSLSSSKSSKRVGVKSFYTHEQREKSFAVAAARKRQSNAKKGTKAHKWSWPSEHPSPESMARAGFYFKPAQGDEDNVACFLCQKNMSEWDPEDDPAEQHVRHNNSCGWALTMCRELVVDNEIESDPFSDEMREARRMTFDNWWPHEGKKGWIPTVENIVMAGFVFRPQKDGDDTVYCPYCKLSIDEWEQNDNPRDVHKSLGSGDCIFMKLAQSAPTSDDNKENTASIEEVGEEATKPGPKKRASRARKNSTNPQRKRTIPKSQVDPEEYQDLVFQGGEVSEETLESSKPSRGKKRASAAMEDGSKKPLFEQDDRAARIFQEQQQYIEDHETPRRPPPKRRVTRASIATNQSELDLIVNVPTHLAHGSDDEGLPTISLHNTPVKPKGKPRKKATRASTSSKASKGKKQTAAAAAAAGPLDLAGLDDEEIDRVLELDILDKNLSDDDNGVVPTDAEPEKMPEIQTKSSSPDTKPSKSLGSNGKKRGTKTKNVEKEIIVDESQAEDKPKQRRKRLTRTKPVARASTDSSVSPALEYPLISPQPPTSPEATQDPEIFAVAEGMSPQESSHENENEVSPQEEDILPSAETEVSTPSTETRPPLQSVSTAPPVSLPAESQDASDKSFTTKQAPKRGRPSKKRSSAQTSNAVSNQPPPSKDKDMKRKSDALVDGDKDAPMGKRRRTIAKSKKSLLASKETSPKKADKPRVSVEKPQTAASSSKDYAAIANQAALSITAEVEISSVKSSVVGPKVDDLVSESSKASSLPQTAVNTENISAESSISADQADESSHKTIGNDRNSTLGVRVTDDISSKDVKPTTRSSESITTPASTSPKRQSLPQEDSQADTTFQDSLPNTQFSALGSQMTMATSFQGSNKGVSFMTTAEDQLLAEQEASFAQENQEDQDQEKALVISPRVTRTPLSVIPKPHNGALALMTPRHRADEMAFAPVQSLQPWKSSDIELYLDELKENRHVDRNHTQLTLAERKMTAAQWITDNAKRAERRLIHNGEMLIKFFEDEATRAIAAIESIETSD